VRREQLRPEQPDVRRRGILVGLAGIAACWAATAAVRTLDGVPGIPLDRSWAHLASTWRDPGTLRVAEVLAALGGAPGSIVVAAGIAAGLWWRRGARSGIGFAVAAGLDEALVTAMKLVDLRPGPSGAVFDDRGSFPSGHTAFAAVVAVSLALQVRSPAARVGLLALVPLMAVSRTLLDAHWLTDTIAGAVLGAATAVLVDALLRGAAQRRRISPSTTAASG
jgi:undecaprenyl-diphosphatase